MRYFLKCAYNGTAYHGWQVQENTPLTVQQVLNEKLSLILSSTIECTGCGRTDTGVHAREFYAHFDAAPVSAPSKFIHQLNAVLPNDIVAYDLYAVADDANARFDATSRSYEYIITLRRDPFLLNSAYYIHYSPDIELMNQAAALLREFEDFGAFCKSNTQTLTNICKITEAVWVRDEHLLKFRISADRFLRNMVRAVVGTLLEVGKGKMTLDQFRAVILSGDRSQAGFSVPACGLYLTNVTYPKGLLNG